MRVGYRDRAGTGEHVVTLDRVTLRFGADGILWGPGTIEQQVLTQDALRRARFERVEETGNPSPGRRGGVKDAAAAAVVTDGAPASTTFGTAIPKASKPPKEPVDD